MKYGIIGLGHRLAHLVRCFAAADQSIEWVAVADPDDVRMPVFEPLDAAPIRYDSPAQMLAEHDLDVIMIGSPNHLHLEHLELALKSNAKFIFAEKPVVTNIEETMALAELMAAHDGVRRILVGMVLRYSPLYRALTDASRQHLGEIMSIEAAEHIAPYHGSFFMRDWRRDTAMSGGFMLEKCCHDLDLYQGLVGARPMEVASFGGRKKYLPERRVDADYLSKMSPRWGGVNDAFGGTGDIIDYQTAIVNYANGATLAFHTNLNVPDEYRRFMVAGVDGQAEGDFLRNYLHVTLSDTGERIIDSTPGDATNDGHYGADDAMAVDIVAHINGTLDQLPLSVIDALEAGVTAMAMDLSRNEKRMIDLAPVWDDFDKALAGNA
ncbi:Gfo/Idh/MocA family protein [Marivivens aquimaris]|uniref:Gfo/Idh/MocA family protein n=1 Tax=Marivivens aquimaris TaxID=2774876 RepID=UPI001882DE47|nr:Gfo/Idh/MocA family oxidoreductase [Marivivens aquimaris]